MKKHHRDVLDLARRFDCRVRQTKSGHFRIEKPGMTPVFISGTPSDRRTFKNAEAEIRKRAAEARRRAKNKEKKL